MKKSVKEISSKARLHVSDMIRIGFISIATLFIFFLAKVYSNSGNSIMTVLQIFRNFWERSCAEDYVWFFGTMLISYLLGRFVKSN